MELQSCNSFPAKFLPIPINLSLPLDGDGDCDGSDNGYSDGNDKNGMYK
jgi:hypothetical protein